jgi:predicted DNA-binding ribbon-helix-helix protein
MPHYSDNWKEAIAAVRNFAAMMSRNVRLTTHRTSFRPDPLTWQALQQIAAREHVTVHELCDAIDKVKPHAVSLTAAIRVAVLRYYMDAATEAGHQKAGHGGRLQ